MDKSDYKKVIITMPNDMVEYLESIGQLSRRTGGNKIAKTEIVRALVKALQNIDVNFESMQGEEEVASRIQDTLKTANS